MLLFCLAPLVKCAVLCCSVGIGTGSDVRPPALRCHIEDRSVCRFSVNGSFPVVSYTYASLPPSPEVGNAVGSACCLTLFPGG